MILQTLDELEADLLSHGLRPLYLILGPEEYQCRLALNRLREKALPPESVAFDYSEFCGSDTSVQKINETANTFPMLSKRRLVLVTDIDKMADSEQDELMDSLDGLSSRSTMILFALDLDHRRKFYRTLREKACLIEFPKLKGVALERWAELFIRRQGFRISSGAIKKIVDLAGSDLQSLSAEMEKLLLYAGKEKSIPDSAVDSLMRDSRQHGIFELIGAIGRRDRAGALRSLANLMNSGEPPLLIVAMMARHCRQVLIAKDCLRQGFKSRDIGTAAQIPPFILDQFLQQARSFDLAAAQEMHMRLADIDRRLKSSTLDGRMLIEEVICALI